MRERIAFYDAKMITEQIGKSDRYETIKQVISIIITEDEFITKSPKYHHRFTMYDKVNDVELTDIVEVHTLELCKIKTGTDDSRLCYWMEFIKAEEIELEAIAQRDPLIKKAVARLMELSADERTRMLFELSEKERMDNETREDWAVKQKDIKTAKAMLAKNEPIEKITEYTDLTRKEIENLKDAN